MYKELIDKIKEYDSIVIARHIGVDPDALCSQLALRDSILLTFPEKKVLAVGTGSQKFIPIGRLDKLEKLDNALLIVCDTPDRKRIDSINVDDYAYSIKIDHHPFVEKVCNYEIIEDNTTSTCEIIMKILKDTELLCNSSIAELLYMGLVSDSNRFLFNSCSSDTFELVSYYLKNYSFDLSKAYEKLYTRPLSEVRLQGFISSNMVVTENHLAYIIIRDKEINEFGVDSASPGNMINDYNYIKEVLVWVTITEDIKNDQFRISIRSRGPEIHDIAELHHGGGHHYASGIRVKSLEEAMDVIHDLDNKLIEYNQEMGENNGN